MKESLLPDILAVSIDAKIDDLWEASLFCFQSSITKAQYHIFKKSWRLFHDQSLLVRWFRGFVLPVLKYCSTVWWSAADTRLLLLDRVVSGGIFLLTVYVYVAFPILYLSLFARVICFNKPNILIIMQQIILLFVILFWDFLYIKIWDIWTHLWRAMIVWSRSIFVSDITCL